MQAGEAQAGPAKAEVTIGLLLWVTSAGLAAYAIASIGRGVTDAGGLVTKKAENPYRFWFAVAATLFLSALGFLGGSRALTGT